MKDNKEKNTKIEAKESTQKVQEKTDKKKVKKTTRTKKTKKSAENKLNEEIKNLNQSNEELKDKYLRLVAEYDNYRKRTAKEKIELRENTKADIMLEFLSVVDDMDRAIEHIDKVKEIDATIDGIKLINNKFKDFLRTQGVEEINAKDTEFDTDFHEAVTKFPVEEEDKKGKVIDVVQKGYKLKEKVIRFSKVVVGE